MLMIQVLVIEEIRSIGEMMAAALQKEPDLEVVGLATNGEELRARIGQCDVALVNAGKHGEATLPLIREIRRLSGQAKIIVIGLACSPAFIVQCAEAGVAGYVSQDESLNELLQILRAAYQNEAHVSPPIAAVFMAYIAEQAEHYQASAQPELRRLTRREREVLTLMQQGLTNQEIAQSLVIELGTVKNHVHNILRKLNINSRRDTLRLARAGAPEWRELSHLRQHNGHGGNGKDAPGFPTYNDVAYPRLARTMPVGVQTN
jgi:DNA-binding NarL/FixJ family response regulator